MILHSKCNVVLSIISDTVTLLSFGSAQSEADCHIETWAGDTLPLCETLLAGTVCFKNPLLMVALTIFSVADVLAWQQQTYQFS